MKTLQSMTVAELLEGLGSKTPAPGGGAVAAVSGALAASLARMVVQYSLGRKSLVAHQDRLQLADSSLVRASRVFTELGDEDAASFGLLSELDKLSPEDPRRRSERPGVVRAVVDVPRATAAACSDLLRLLESLTGITNRGLRSDLEVAAVLAQAALRAAECNVAVNLPLIEDEGERSRLRREVNAMVEEGGARAARVAAACRE